VPSKRIKIRILDDEGNKITVSFEGRISRNKILQLLDLTEILVGIPTSGTEELQDISKIEKMHNIIERKFPVGWFKSQEIMISYEDAFDEPIGLSTVSTYLSRLTTRGFLTRRGSLAQRRYKVKKIYKIKEQNII